MVCPNCLTPFETKPELFVHLQLSHSNVSTYLCGICLKQTDSETSLKLHVEKCVKTYPLTNRYFCDVCYFDDNDYSSMESHVLVHNFLWESCQKEVWYCSFVILIFYGKYGCRHETLTRRTTYELIRNVIPPHRLKTFHAWNAIGLTLILSESFPLIAGAFTQYFIAIYVIRYYNQIRTHFTDL